MLIKLLRDVNEDLNGIPKKEIDWIRSFVQSAVREVIFLFKHDDYADEAEYRLVVTRPQDSPNGIRLIPSEPDMLCVNPYFQICILSQFEFSMPKLTGIALIRLLPGKYLRRVKQ